MADKNPQEKDKEAGDKIKSKPIRSDSVDLPEMQQWLNWCAICFNFSSFILKLLTFDPTRVQTLMSALAQPYMTALRVITKNVQTHWALMCASVSQAFKIAKNMCQGIKD